MANRFLLCLLILLPGCARVTVQRECECLTQSSCQRTGHPIQWKEPCVPSTAPKGAISLDEAVALALENNRTLQMELEKVGIAKADLVQAGLLSNPSLSLDWRLPNGMTCVEGGLLFTASDLWQLPLRKKMAAAELEGVLLELTGHILNTVAQAKLAYWERVIAKEKVAIAKQGTALFEKLKEQLLYRQQFGQSSDLETALALVGVADQRIATLDLEKMEMRSILELRFALGFNDCSGQLVVAPTLCLPHLELPPIESLRQIALCNSPELLRLRRRVRQQEARAALARARFLRWLGLGPAVVKDPGAPWGFGPGISVELPIFDQNQAQIARANYQWRQAKKELCRTEDQVVMALRQAVTRYHTALNQLQVYDEQLIPGFEKAIKYARKYATKMQITQVIWLEQERGYVMAQQKRLDLMSAAFAALVEIERLVGGQTVLEEATDCACSNYY